MEQPYYLSNFLAVLQDVAERYGDLLLPSERARSETFLGLPGPAQRLYVRMLSRRGPWFRTDALAYAEIEDLPAALRDLEAAGFCAGADRAAPADLAALLRKDEIEALLKAAAVPFRRSEARDVLAERLLDQVPEPVLRGAVKAATPLAGDWARLLFMLFFGNREQGLADFVVADLGHVRYEDYEVEAACRLFQSRREVDFLLSLDGLREAFEAGGDLEEVTRTLLDLEAYPGIRPQRRYHRLLNDVGREWERRGDSAAALDCYRRSAEPPSRERTVRIHLAEKRFPDAAETALAMAEGPLDTQEERLARRFRGRRAAREPRAARWMEAHPPAPAPPALHLRVPRHPSGSVEQAALAAAAGWEGFHTENVLWNALFGLAFWDILFAPVPGAFQHRFQTGPADLRSPGFLAPRRAAIEARLAELEEPGAARRLILGTADRKWGVANAFVHWRGLTREQLETALECIPPTALLAVLGKMAPNPSAFRSGFPDLFLHRRGQCRLWEVKGPGDTLRPEQERWLAVFNQAGLEACVAWVDFAEPSPGEDLDLWQRRFEAFWAGRPAGDGAHDVHHLRRVWRSARLIAATEPGADLLALLAAAYLHDLVNPPKDSPLRSLASRLSAQEAIPLLEGFGFDPGRARSTAHAIEAHSFSAGIEPRTLEARILQDADRLEALGAIGLARCFYTGGRMGTELWEGEDPLGRSGRALDDRQYSVDHFKVKLLRLPDLMRTTEGRCLARRRTRVLERFLAELDRELQEGAPDDTSLDI
jgi:HD superfamily phosphodiesterase